MSERSAAMRASIQRAVVQILEAEGASGVSHQRVADAAGVGRATVYRHYPTVEELLEDSILANEIPKVPVPDELPTRARLVNALQLLVVELTTPAAVAVITTVIDKARQPGKSRELRDAYVASLMHELQTVIKAGEASGTLRQGSSERDQFDLLVGPIFSRCCFQGEGADDEFVELVVDNALHRWLISD